MEYRHELKHIVSSEYFTMLEHRLNNVMKLDEHIKGSSYNIRSIYFDDYYNSYVKENESGLNNRSKIRIRIYDQSDKIIKLEIKYKLHGMTKKESCNITREMCEQIIRGECPSFINCKDNKVLSRLYLEMKTRLLKPVTIVEYERTPYIYEAGNIRVTFDMNIRTSTNFNLFFEKNLYSIPILEANKHVLEVKYDEFIPDHISQLIELNNLQQTSFSKYYLSRVALGGN